MRNLIVRAALVAGATLTLAACGSNDAPVSNAANELDMNTALEPMNDQSATESVGNAMEPAPTVATNEAGNSAGTEPDADGGETIETNTPGI